MRVVAESYLPMRLVLQLNDKYKRIVESVCKITTDDKMGKYQLAILDIDGCIFCIFDNNYEKLFEMASMLSGSDELRKSLDMSYLSEVCAECAEISEIERTGEAKNVFRNGILIK